ncbi:FKBP-type peptidyl-prolyl cis-trans isomerase [Catenovulum sp. 2E275]|uniref:FKBP-type peptidyl-prolyl cis-trans isomerase n=1 Tax=Catenovulum sp. 2E275 TaxID=2980497 RepID=UPI0021CE8AB5|nr:FKBP-type peptidyl-prolyl cis-trans isomerase [Catenovulum sp. 2E275]MCU4676284.1 FKBP-type peptidyl-prolyl cis-trans isomerase [Catenovulum sp. 2E275]
MSNLINSGSEVVMHFAIRLEDGSAAESTKVHNKPAKFVMGDGSLTENFESCLLGLKAGDNKTFKLKPEDAFGLPNPDNIYHLDKNKFSADVPASVGEIIAFTQPDGQEIAGIVRDVAGNSVTVDFNHPLAGLNLEFEVEIISVN